MDDQIRLLSNYLNEEFLEDYRKFATEFDKVMDVDFFHGQQLESLAKDFLKKHQNYIDSFPYETNYRFPNCSQSEAIEEDYNIVCDNEETANRVAARRSAGGDQQAEEEEETQQQRATRQVLSDIYRRASTAAYLRLTYNKSRHNREENRREPVDLARRAIRYDSSNFLACYWFMISLGWLVENVTNAKERTYLGRVFRHSALHCVRLNPKDPLAHHLIGRYFYNIANLSWIERTLAKGLLGVKIEGSYEEAEKSLLHAHQMNDWLPTGLWMARVLLAQQRPMEEVKRWIDFGLSLDAKEPTTEIERNELLELRTKLKLCSN